MPMQIESLERRQMLAVTAPTYILTNGTLVVTGTDAVENVILRLRPANRKYMEVIINGVLKRNFTASSVKSIRIDALGGNDEIHLETLNVASTLNGGLGADLIYGGGAADRINGGAGNDTVNAGAGNDTVYGDSGHDKLFGQEGRDYIVAGAGKDVVRGGPDKDRIVATIGLDDIRENAGDIVTNVVA